MGRLTGALVYLAATKVTKLVLEFLPPLMYIEHKKCPRDTDIWNVGARSGVRQNMSKVQSSTTAVSKLLQFLDSPKKSLGTVALLTKSGKFANYIT